ncbi:retrovirus-related pol polyprotein from transposon TNT 1-94 [Tanacetum coccineum]
MRKVKRPVPNYGESTSENLCNIILKYRGRKLTCKMNTHDYYLHGYKGNNGKLRELRLSKDKVKRLRDSNGHKYPKLKGLKINRGSLVFAFNKLAQMRPNTEILNDVASLCLVLAEASRFNPIGTGFGPLVWPTITVDGATRPKEYTKLTAAETIQADYDIKAINIILQGTPSEIYALVSQHRVAKDIWEKIQLLMQGTSLTKHERECKLYDEFDKFTYKRGESLQEYYLRFTLVLNDMNIYKMPLEQF